MCWPACTYGGFCLCNLNPAPHQLRWCAQADDRALSLSLSVFTFVPSLCRSHALCFPCMFCMYLYICLCLCSYLRISRCLSYTRIFSSALSLCLSFCLSCVSSCVVALFFSIPIILALQVSSLAWSSRSYPLSLCLNLGRGVRQEIALDDMSSKVVGESNSHLQRIDVRVSGLG